MWEAELKLTLQNTHGSEHPTNKNLLGFLNCSSCLPSLWVRGGLDLVLIQTSEGLGILRFLSENPEAFLESAQNPKETCGINQVLKINPDCYCWGGSHLA